jgi:hypothetical protein
MNTQWNDLKAKLENGLKQTQGRTSPWLWAIAVAAFLAFYWDYSSQPQESDAREPQPVETASTYIPAGYVLVPIEISNYESLDSILGQHGVVDLYRPSNSEGQRSVKVAERVKILRAPLNPSHFAVLAPENESQALVAYDGPYTVVVQNPTHSTGMRFVKPGSTGDLQETAGQPSSEGKTDSKKQTKRARSRVFVEVQDADEA